MVANSKAAPRGTSSHPSPAPPPCTGTPTSPTEERVSIPHQRRTGSRFKWTHCPGLGSGTKVFGDPRRAPDLGPTEGREAVFLTRQGVPTTGVDLSAAQVDRASR